MVMMYAAKALATAVEVGSPRHRGELGRALAVQVVPRTAKMDWITKPQVIRNVPITAARPTPRLAEMRVFVIDSSGQWRNKTGRDRLEFDSRSGKHKAGDMVLAVQAAFQRAIRTAAAKLTKPRSKTFEDGRYRTYKVYRIHTRDELVKLAGLTTAAAPAAR
jgi:hypothetical protein